ncbi:MAG: tripartite tricarboxylate transporter permease [Peptococcaceae bacterium]
MQINMIQQVQTALINVLSFEMVLWVFIGVGIGIVFGALPGLTATTGVAVFTPMTFYMSFDVSMALLLGIFCGGYYAGSIPAILIKTPGAPGNAATILDGYTMAEQGKAGKALGLSIVSSVFGGIFSALVLLFFAPLLGNFATKFGSAEYFAVGLIGLVCVASVSGKSLVKGIAAALIGMILGCIGMDPISGIPRLTLGSQNLSGGISLIPALIGFFAITEVLVKVEEYSETCTENVLEVTKVVNNLRECFAYKWLLVKSSLIGTIIGALPGTGPTIASWVSYNEAKRSSKNPEEFGTGISAGVIASEAANNAVTGGAMIPLLTLGIPGDTVTAILLGALMIQGLTPGPMLIKENYGTIVSILIILIIANLFMLVLGLFASKMFPYIIRIPQAILIPLIIVLCVTGGFAYGSSYFDVKILLILGVFGFILNKYGFPIPPVVLGLVLGPIIEPNFRRALISAEMNPFIFFQRPLSLGLIILAVLILVFLTKTSK